MFTNYVELMLYDMLCYPMKKRIWLNAMKLYAMVWDSNAMVWNFTSLLCYWVCCKKYAWTECKRKKAIRYS